MSESQRLHAFIVFFEFVPFCFTNDFASPTARALHDRLDAVDRRRFFSDQHEWCQALADRDLRNGIWRNAESVNIDAQPVAKRVMKLNNSGSAAEAGLAESRGG